MTLQNLPLKKIFLSFGFLLIIVIIGWLIYTVFFKIDTGVPPPDGTATTTPPTGIGLPGTTPGVPIPPDIIPIAPGTLPDAIAKGGVTETSSVVNTWVENMNISGNDVSYYNAIDNKFYSVDPNGNIVALSNQKFPDVDNVAWSPTSDKAIIEFPDGANVYYNFMTDKQVTLPSHWTDFSFAPDSNQILFKSLALDPENNFLLRANADGNNPQILSFLGENADIVSPDWSPNKQIVATYSKPLDGSRSTVNFVGLNGENFKRLVVNGFNYDGIWSPDGTQILYNVSSFESDHNPTLWIVNAKGNAIGTGRQPLNIKTTADKCVFADSITVYCAVPQFQPSGTGLMPSLGDGIPDDIYKINVHTGASSKIAVLEIPLPIKSISISGDNRYLYLIDTPTNNLRKIRLK